MSHAVSTLRLFDKLRTLQAQDVASSKALSKVEGRSREATKFYHLHLHEPCVSV